MKNKKIVAVSSLVILVALAAIQWLRNQTPAQTISRQTNFAVAAVEEISAPVAQRSNRVTVRYHAEPVIK